MRNPIPAARRHLNREGRRLRKMAGRLRRREGTLSCHSEQGGPHAREAALVAADVGCILTDYLDLAAAALERAARAEGLPAGGEEEAGATGGQEEESPR